MVQMVTNMTACLCKDWSLLSAKYCWNQNRRLVNSNGGRKEMKTRRNRYDFFEFWFVLIQFHIDLIFMCKVNLLLTYVIIQKDKCTWFFDTVDFPNKTMISICRCVVPFRKLHAANLAVLTNLFVCQILVIISELCLSEYLSGNLSEQLPFVCPNVLYLSKCCPIDNFVCSKTSC